MDLGPLRATVVARNFDVFGFPATVTLAYSNPITTRGIWITLETEEVPAGGEYPRREPKRIMALSKADVPTIPRGTTIVAPEKAGDAATKTWKVDALELAEAEHHRVVLVEVDC